MTCAHCFHATHDGVRRLCVCPTCKVVTFCHACYDEAMVYHHSLCDAIREDNLFDVDNAYSVARDGSGKCQRLK